MNVFETGDVLMEIMIRVNDEYLEDIKMLNNYIYEIYNSDIFWYKKIVQKYPGSEQYKKDNETWKDFYFLLKNNFENDTMLLLRKIIIEKDKNNDFESTDFELTDFETNENLLLELGDIEKEDNLLTIYTNITIDEEYELYGYFIYDLARNEIFQDFINLEEGYDNISLIDIINSSYLNELEPFYYGY